MKTNLDGRTRKEWIESPDERSLRIRWEEGKMKIRGLQETHA